MTNGLLKGFSQSDPACVHTTLTSPSLSPQLKNTLINELQWLESPTCDVVRVAHLANQGKSNQFPVISSPLVQHLNRSSFVTRNCYVLSHCHFGPRDNLSLVKKWLTAGPRRCLYFRAQDVKACVVTCGGLCPGLNAVIREIVLSLNNNYNVSQVLGVQNGYRGFYTEEEYRALTKEGVMNIHH